MKITLDIVGALLIVAGGVWFLQGINVLPGSVMSGQTQWIIYGGITAMIGIGLLAFANRSKVSRTGK